VNNDTVTISRAEYEGLLKANEELKAFDLTPANIREQAKLLAAELKSIEEGETEMAAAR